MSSKKHSITRSFIIVPLMATTLSMNAFTATVNNTVAPTLSADTATTASVSAEPASVVQTDTDYHTQEESEKAAKIDAYFSKYGMPLAGYGMKMVTEAEKYGLDWRLIPAIAIRESTGGLHQCTNVGYNPFGFGSCRFGFKSYNDAIATLAANLGGADPHTASAYKGKTTMQKLMVYNPPTIVATYAQEVNSIMSTIAHMPVPTTVASTSVTHA